ELGNRLQKLAAVNFVELSCELIERVRRHFAHMSRAILVTQQVGDFRVINLPGELSWLLKDGLAVLCVSVVPEVRALIDEAPTITVDHDAERIRMALVLGRQRQLTKILRISFPGDCVAPGPVTMWLRPSCNSHGQPITSIETGASDLGEVPTGSEIFRAPLCVGLEAATRQHHGGS